MRSKTVREELRIASIVGTRPQFIKAAMVNHAIKHHNNGRKKPKIREILVHTGQHYDHNMNKIFFDHMKIPLPHYNLEVGSGTHARMTSEMLAKIERILIKEHPDWVLVYGDTNTSLAGAFAASKLPLPIAHVESGLRSFNLQMPEEINRVIIDHISCILFSPTDVAASNLKKEGIAQGVFKVGDVMYDAYLAYKDLSLFRSDILLKLNVQPKSYCLATIHRQENTDDSSRLLNIFRAFDELAKKECPFIVPLHPRTKKKISEQKYQVIKNSHVHIINPLDYLDMLVLESRAHMILTDSGGIQKEALFARVPCITLREETEWVETVETGWNYLSGATTERIVAAFHKAEKAKIKSSPDLYGKGNASKLIIDTLISNSPFDLKAWKPSFMAISKEESKTIM